MSAQYTALPMDRSSSHEGTPLVTSDTKKSYRTVFASFLAACLAIAFVLGLLIGRHTLSSSWHQKGEVASTINDTLLSLGLPISKEEQTRIQTIGDIIRALYDPLKISPTEPSIQEPDGDGAKLILPPNPRFTKPLGKDVLILDVETRDLPSTADFEKGEFNWRNINHPAGGIFNHYAYAQIHGYDYKFLKAADFEDRGPTWTRPVAIANELKKYKFLVTTDADVTWRFMHVPLEWMFNYWDLQPQHSLTMPKDPNDELHPEINADRFNRTLANCGFIVAQNNEMTQEILKAWHECPNETRYPGCAQWKTPRFHEQSAFGNYVRYDYPDNLKELPCAEANGFPGFGYSACHGKFARHYWFDKTGGNKDFADNTMNALTYQIQKVFSEKSGVVFEQPENNIQEEMVDTKGSTRTRRSVSPGRHIEKFARRAH